MLSAARLATLAGFLFIAFVEVFAAFDRSRGGTLDAVLRPDGPTSNTRFIVTAANAAGPLRPGDRFEIDDPGTLVAMTLHCLEAGTTVRVVRTAPPPRAVLLVPVKRHTTPQAVSALVLGLQALFIAVAALIALRGRSAGSLPLAWFFALVTQLANPTTPAWPTWLVLGYAIFGGALEAVVFVCATEFATQLGGDGEASWAGRTRAVSRALGLVAAALNAAAAADSSFAAYTPVIVANVPIGTFSIQAALFLIALTLAYRKSPVGDRQRVLWVAASLAIGIVGFMISIFLGAAGIDEPLRDYPLLLLIAMPLGCAYAILRYRLLDIAFVINRATVFGLTSLLVLGGLALIDSGLQSLLGSWLVRTGISVQLGLALAIGIATRPLHERVDRFVDDIFFRKRHEAERTLRRFAREVAYIDDTDVVVERTAATVAQAASLHCSLLLAGADGALRDATAPAGAPPVDRNDDGVVRLRATREPVDLREAATAIRGDFAFPMIARNRLLGILVCADKTDGVAAYAPDELEAIGAVAHAAGLAIDLLRIEALERELAATRGLAGGSGPVAAPGFSL